jgi:hypothetical protein
MGASALTGLSLGEAHGAQTRLAMQAPLAGRARLTIAQARALCGVAAETCDLDACCVRAIEGLGRQRHGRTNEAGIPSGAPGGYEHQRQMALQWPMLNHLMVALDVFIVRSDLLEARQSAAGDFPLGGLRPSWAPETWPAVEVTQMGSTTEVADQGHLHGTEALDALLLTARAIDHHGLARLERRRRDAPGTLRQIGSDTRLRSGTVRPGGGCATLRA